MNKELYLSEIKKRLTRHFLASKEGYKTPAPDRHRLEGFIQGAIFMNFSTSSELSALMEDIHISIFGITIKERSTANKSIWQDNSLEYEIYDQPTYTRRNNQVKT